MPTAEEITAQIIANRILKKRKAKMVSSMPAVPDSFVAPPQPSSTAVVPQQKPEPFTGDWWQAPTFPGRLREFRKQVGGRTQTLFSPKELSEGTRQLLDEIVSAKSDPTTAKGLRNLGKIYREFTKPLEDWYYFHPQAGLQELSQALITGGVKGVKQNIAEHLSNIMRHPVAGPMTLGMILGAKRPIKQKLQALKYEVSPKARVSAIAETPSKPKPAPKPKAKEPKTIGRLPQEAEARLAALDDIYADLLEQKGAAKTFKQRRALDDQMRAIGRQKFEVVRGEPSTAEAGRIYIPVEEVRAATDKAIKALDLRTAPETQTVKALDAIRRGDIAEADVRVGFAQREIQRVVPDLKRREAITAAIENPKLEAGLSEIEKGVKNEIRRFYDEGFQVANDADVITSAVENYINHVWETESPKRRLFTGKYITTKTPFAKQRKIPTIAEGEGMGLTAKTKDPGELMNIWSRSVHRAIANKRFLDQLKVAQAEDGRLLVQPYNSAPSDYVSYDHPSLRQYRWRGAGKKGAIYQTGVKIHPDIAAPIEVAFGQGWRPRGKWAQRVFNGYTALDKATKKSILTISLFHYHALSESAIATGQTPLAFIKGVAKLAGNEELVVRMKRAQLGIGGTPDVARQSLRFEKIPPLRETVGRVIEKNDEFLWDNVHAGHKTEAFDRITRSALTDKRYSHLKPEIIDKTVATFLNDAFGGLDWEGLGASAKKQWIYQRSLLAPDWTRAQIRVFKGMFKLGAKGTPERLSGQLYRAYWRRAIMYNLGGVNALNYVFTAWKAGDPRKGHFMIQNAPGHRFQLEMPYEGSDGKPRWIQVGKQFMEPFRYIEDLMEGRPLRTISGKINPIPRMIASTVYNRKYPGGPAIYKKDDPPHIKYLKQLGYYGQSAAPIPFQQFIESAKGRKDLIDAAVSAAGFPVKKDYGRRRKTLRP